MDAAKEKYTIIVIQGAQMDKEQKAMDCKEGIMQYFKEEGDL